METKYRKGDKWYFNEISFKSLDSTTYIGTHRTLSNCEWMDYNSDIIAIVRGYKSNSNEYNATYIKALFDISTKLIVEGSQNDLLEYYNQYFKNENRNKDENIVFQKKLLIKR